MTTTPIYDLTEWAAAQSAPWLPHNAALRALEAVGRGSIADRDLAAPPGSCADGAAYLVDASPTGAWAGKAGKMAVAVGADAGNGWLFLTIAREGQILWVDDEDIRIQYDGAVWNDVPLGGTSAGLDYDTDGTLAANSDAKIATQKAVKTYVDAIVTGLLDLKGSTDCSANPNYPAASKGDAYVVSVAGKIGGGSGVSVDIGDVYFAKADNAGGTQASVGTSWTVLEHNLAGALLAANNLSDLASASTALDNLGFSADAKSLIAAANFAAMRTLLGLGTVALLDADTDDTLAADSDAKIATQKAVKTFVEGLIAGLGTGSGVDIDTDGTLAANSDAKVATQKAVKTYVDNAVTGLLDFKGGQDCSANPNYPAALKGDAYVVTVAGKIGGASGVTVAVGDVYFANADNAGGTQAGVGASWQVLEHNLVGALLAANNLSDLTSVSTALDNLGFTADAKTLIALANYAAMRSALGAAVAGAATASLITMATARILGRTSGSSGAIEEISIGNGLDLASGTLKIAGTAPITEATTARVSVIGDAMGWIDFTNAGAVAWTIPPNSSVAFPVGTVIQGCQMGAGTVTITAGAGVTLRSRGGFVASAGQYAVFGVKQVAADEWVVIGDVA